MDPKQSIILGSTLSLSKGPRSAVGNVSGYRCVSDCRSRGREFNPGPGCQLQAKVCAQITG